MKRFLPILLLTGFSSPVMADITHKLSSSVQLQVNAAATQVERIGSSWSVSGNGVDTTDGTTAPEMMLLPYIKEPATGSLIPSI